MKQNIKIYYFLVSVIGGVFATAMPIYYTNLHFTSIQIGILIAIPSAAMLMQPFWGILVDKYNIARELGILGIVISSFILLPLAFTTKFSQVVVIVSLYAFIKTPVWSSIDNIIITYCMNNNINYGPLRVYASIAWGASLILFLPFNLVLGFKSYFVINTLVSIYLGLIISKLPKNIKLNDNPHGHDKDTIFDGIKFLLTDSTYKYLILYTLFLSTLFVTNLNYQALYFKELGQSQLFISVAMFLSIFPELFILPYVERISHKYNPIHLLLFVSGAYVMKYMIYAISTNITILLLAAMLHGVAMSFYIPTYIKLIKASVPNNISTTALTFNGFIAACAGISISLIAGIVSQKFGINYVFFVVAIAQACGFIVLLFFKFSKNTYL